MKKTILVVLSSMLLSGSLLANADAISQETTETGIVFTQKKVVSSPRNPKDPREPFIGKQGFIDTFEDDNEQNHSLATQANPKLLSCNEETDFGLSHVPANLSFGVIRDTEGVSVYRSHGNGVFYEDENFFYKWWIIVINHLLVGTLVCNCKIRFLLLVVPIKWMAQCSGFQKVTQEMS